MRQIGHRVTQIEGLRLEVLLARKRQKLTHKTGGAVRVLRDLDQVGIFRIARLVTQQQQVAMPADRRKQVVEIMRDTARELPDRLHLLALDELRFEGLQLGRIIQDTHQHRATVLDPAPKRDLKKQFLAGHDRAHDFGFQKPPSVGRVRQPVGDGAAHTLDQFEERRQGVFFNGENRAGLLVGLEQRAFLADLQHRHGQNVQQVRDGKSGGVFTLPGHAKRRRRQECDLRALTARLDLDQTRFELGAIGGSEAVKPPLPQRQIHDDIAQRSPSIPQHRFGRAIRSGFPVRHAQQCQIGLDHA